MKPELIQLCESLGLRFIDSDDRDRSSLYFGESRGFKFGVDIPYDAEPAHLAELIFDAGKKAMRKKLGDQWALFTSSLNKD